MFAGVPGVIHGVDVDTSFFTGNYAPRCSIQAACLDTSNFLFKILLTMIEKYHELSENKCHSLPLLIQEGQLSVSGENVHNTG